MCVNLTHKILPMKELGATCMHEPVHMELRNKYLCFCTCWPIYDRSRKHMCINLQIKACPCKRGEACVCELAPIGIPMTELENAWLWTWTYTIAYGMASKYICVWTYTCTATAEAGNPFLWTFTYRSTYYRARKCACVYTCAKLHYLFSE